jgi:hypothetical protein
MFGNIVNTLVWLLLAVWIVVSGWQEPLKYYFMSNERVDAEERPFRATPTPPPDYRNWSRPSTGASTLGNSPIGGNGVFGTPRRTR